GQGALRCLAGVGLGGAALVQVEVGAAARGAAGGIQMGGSVGGSDQAYQGALGPLLPAADAGPHGRWRCHSEWASPLMSTRQPVSLAARRAFWPSRPMASESWSRGTVTCAVRLSWSMSTAVTRAGPSAAATKRSGSASQG